jgi:hypothetical protein
LVVEADLRGRRKRKKVHPTTTVGMEDGGSLAVKGERERMRIIEKNLVV